MPVHQNKRGKMKNFLVLVLLLVISLSFVLGAEPSQKQKLLIELLEVTKAKTALEISRDMIIADMPEGTKDIIMEIMNPNDLIKEIQKVYDRHLDEKTIKAVLVFFKTPEGKKWVEAQSQILKDTMILTKLNAEKKLNKLKSK